MRDLTTRCSLMEGRADGPAGPPLGPEVSPRAPGPDRVRRPVLGRARAVFSIVLGDAGRLFPHGGPEPVGSSPAGLITGGGPVQPFTLGDRSLLRSDPGQSQSGNSTLSPRAYRATARPPNWLYRRFDRSPLSMPLGTAVGAPSRGASVSTSGGGRTDRWPQMDAIPPEAVLRWSLILQIDAVSQSLSPRNRERLAGGAGGGNERPCSPARRRRHPRHGRPLANPSSGSSHAMPPWTFAFAPDAARRAAA
jgi:hypothetical protein